MIWSRAYTSLMEIIPEAFSPLYPRAFIVVTNSLDSPDNMLTNNALYPWGTNTGKDKRGLSIGISICSAKFKHKKNAIMQHQPVFKLHLVQLPVEPPLSFNSFEKELHNCSNTVGEWRTHHQRWPAPASSFLLQVSFSIFPTASFSLARQDVDYLQYSVR